MNPLVKSLAASFHRTHGGEFEDLYAEANLHYARACADFDPGRGMTFASWIRFRITHGLLETARAIAKQSRRYTMAEADFNTMEDRPRFDVDRFVFDLSEDARTVVGLVTTPPPDVRLTAACSRGEDHPPSIKRGVIEFLHAIGWGAARITEAFSEIGRALQP
jgi:hypothetical protein